MAAAALGGRYLIVAWPIIRARVLAPRARKFYYGGFETVVITPSLSYTTYCIVLEK